MAEYCDTTITFTGDTESLADLFSKLQTGWLGDIADIFDVQAHCSGSIENIDVDFHTIYQTTRWEPNIELWNQIITKHYENKVSFVYLAVEPFQNIFINSDVSHKIFPDKYFCDYEIKNSADTAYYTYDKEQLFLELIKDLTGQSVRTFEEAKEACSLFNSSHNEEFIHVGRFEPEQNAPDFTESLVNTVGKTVSGIRTCYANC